MEPVEVGQSLRIMRLKVQVALALALGALTSALLAVYAKAPPPQCAVPASHPCGGTFPCGGKYMPCPGPHVRLGLVVMSGITVFLLTSAAIVVRHRRR